MTSEWLLHVLLDIFAECRGLIHSPLQRSAPIQFGNTKKLSPDFKRCLDVIFLIFRQQNTSLVYYIKTSAVLYFVLPKDTPKV